MGLKRIQTGAVSSDNLPWVGDFVMEDPQRVDLALWVEEVFQTARGYLVVTEQFKGFVFADSAMFTFLREALEVWTGGIVDPSPLFAIAAKSGKIELAIDDEMPKSYWSKDGRRWIQRRGKFKASLSSEKRANPLLPSPSRASGGTKAKKTTDTDEYVDLARMTH